MRFPHLLAAGSGRVIAEFPLSTVGWGGWRFPVAGGGYLRLLPYAVTRWAVNRLNREGQAAIVYLHPWEIDPDQPRVAAATMKTRFRHYVNLHRTEARLGRLLGDFRWDTMSRTFAVDAV